MGLAGGEREVGRSVKGWLQGEEVGFIGTCVLGALAAKRAVLGG